MPSVKPSKRTRLVRRYMMVGGVKNRESLVNSSTDQCKFSSNATVSVAGWSGCHDSLAAAAAGTGVAGVTDAEKPPILLRAGDNPDDRPDLGQQG